MADGNFLHQPSNGNCELGFVAASSEVPLLPYEKQLIKTIGCTEEEYRYFVSEAVKRAKVRPAGYEHIPEIKNDFAVTPVIVSLVVGALFSVAAAVLAPKPKVPKPQKITFEGSSRSLGSVTGANRFNSTFGFETIAELASFAEVIPIVFGLYNRNRRVGGIFVSPKLVWSRMFSYGTQQAAQLQFVVGEQGKTVDGATEGIKPPDLAGIFVGNNALDAVLSEYFDFYWKRNTFKADYFRIRQQNKQYGKANVLNDTIPTGPLDEVFVAPTLMGDNDVAFCSAYSPVNNTEFGVYAPLANGTFYRVPWRVVSRPDFKDEKGRLNAERHKIAGYVSDGNLVKSNDVFRGNYEEAISYMVGTGRNYSCRMGIIEVQNKPNNSVEIDDEFKTLHNVDIGTRVVYRIAALKVPEELYDFKATVEDINTAVENLQISADEALQIGEIFAIGSTLWKVVSREADQFNTDKFISQYVTLECIDVSDALYKKVGSVTQNLVIDASKGFVNDDTPFVGIAWYPLTRYARGLVRNNRPCDTTEIGLASTVFQQLSGLANFPSMPSSDDLYQADRQKVSITSGQISSYATRSSFFTVHIRPAGVDGAENIFPFEPTRLWFVVTGNRPVAQYNQIRFKHPLPGTGAGFANPEALKEYEYKFVPIPSPDLRALEIELGGNEPVIHLDTNAGIYKRIFAPGSYGNFTLEVRGKVRSLSEFKRNKEFESGRQVITTTEELPDIYGEVIDSMRLDDIYPERPLSNTRVATAVEIASGAIGSPVNSCWGRQGSFISGIFGRADAYPIGLNETATKEVLEKIGNRWIIIRYTAKKIKHLDGHFTSYRNGQVYGWELVGATCVTSSGGWSFGDEFEVRRGANATGDGLAFTTGNNAYFYNREEAYFATTNSCTNLTSAAFPMRVTYTYNLSQRGDNQGYYYQLFGSADEVAEGSTKTTLITASDGSNAYQLEVEVKAVTPDHWYYTVGTRIWQTSNVRMANDNGNPLRSDLRLYHTIAVDSNNNIAADYYREGVKLVGRYVVGSVRTAVVQEGTTVTSTNVLTDRIFEGQPQWAEQSFYRGSVSKSCDDGPEHRITYVNESIHTAQEAQYPRLTTAGLSLRASRSFTRLDQLRCWLAAGITCRRLHPDLSTYEDPDNGTNLDGASNLYTDLVYFLLTNLVAGAGSATNMSAESPNMIDVESFVQSSRFLRQNELFCNGAITEKINIQDFIAETAPSFLCNFVIKNGKFGLVPVVPTTASGAVDTGPVTIKQFFTDGNILEDTFELEYLSAEERKPFKANLRYRYERENKLPEERVVSVDYKEYGEAFRDVETFDLMAFCTSQAHAELVGRYFLLVRDLVTHSIQFSTTASGLDLAPGDFIKVETEVTPYSSSLNGTVSGTGEIVSLTDLPDGQYNVLYYAAEGESVVSGVMQVSNGFTTDSTFFNSVFTIQEKIASQNIYQVEQITFNEDMTVAIVASEYPCNDSGESKLALGLVDKDLFIVSGVN